MARTRPPRQVAFFGALAAFAALALAAPGLRRAALGAAMTGGGGASDDGTQNAQGALRDALDKIAALEEKVDAGSVVPRYGARAQEILAAAGKKAGAARPQVEQLVDLRLQALFFRQVALLEQDLSARFADADGREANLRADEQFLAQAEDLLRPGSEWSFDPEREFLQARVVGGLRNRALLSEARADGARKQRATIESIRQLQEKMERIAQKAQSAGQGVRSGGSPWVLSTSYRIPKTPLQFVGRYDQGRASVELSLTPEQDPSKSDKSVSDVIGPANIGASFNLGI